VTGLRFLIDRSSDMVNKGLDVQVDADGKPVVTSYDLP
jgi:hypothetical protein